MKIGKYEFKDKNQADKKIKALIKTDADGNDIPHNNTVVVLGYLTLEQAEYNEEGEVIKEAVLSDKYCVDVLWSDKQARGWSTYKADVSDEGKHCFLGVKYQGNKV